MLRGIARGTSTDETVSYPINNRVVDEVPDRASQE